MQGGIYTPIFANNFYVIHLRRFQSRPYNGGKHLIVHVGVIIDNCAVIALAALERLLNQAGVAVLLNVIDVADAGEGAFQAVKSQGLMILSPVVAKSFTFRVATFPPWQDAIAAIMPSGTDMGCPSRLAAPTIFP